MKFLVVGAWHWGWYQHAFAEGLKSLGHEVRGFGWAELFLEKLHTELTPAPKNLWIRFQQRAGWGPLVARLNRDLVRSALQFAPDVVFGYNATLVLPSALKRIKQALPNTVLVQYSNDNPFSKKADWLLWRHLKASIPLYDLHFAYRHANFQDIARYGGRNVHLLRSYYIPETDYRDEPAEGESRFTSDVVFVGHYEPDGRLELLEAVAASGVDFKLFGGGWQLAEPRLSRQSPLRSFFPVPALSRTDYRKAISGTKIALCFLSKLNGDTYTRRTFEIPAMQTFMLSEYSDDLASLFEEGADAAYFRSKHELVQKVAYYLNHDEERRSIASKGHARLLRDQHDVTARARQVAQVIDAHVGKAGATSRAPLRVAPYSKHGEAG